MQKNTRWEIRRYAFAILVVAATLGIKWLLHPYLAGHAAFLLDMVPVAAAAWYGGLWIGILSSFVIAVCVDYLFLFGNVYSSDRFAQYLRVLFFVVEGTFISIVIDALRRLNEQNALLLKESERANQIKDEFLANVSHDLRNPITSIVSWLHLLKSGKLSAEQTDSALESVERGVKLQLRLINDLFDAARIASGKLRIILEDAPFDALMQSAVDSVRPLANEKGLRVDCQFQIGNTQVRCDPERIKQAVLNLLANAIKFTPSGGMVTMRTCANERNVEVAVCDTGCGIAQENIPRMFERFSQEARTMERHSGLGLGLAIAKHIIVLHGGTITATSTGINKGSTFTITLPLRG